VEVAACLERAINFAHTGNSKVLQKRLMDPLFLTRGIVRDGLPVLSEIVHLGHLANTKPSIDYHLWLTDSRRMPVVGSLKSQTFRFGSQQASVSCHFS
jgi:hypothetical protein